MDDALKDPERVIVGGRWVNHNKGDSDAPKCRGRYVAQEVNVGVRRMRRFTPQPPPRWRQSASSSAATPLNGNAMVNS